MFVSKIQKSFLITVLSLLFIFPQQVFAEGIVTNNQCNEQGLLSRRNLVLALLKIEECAQIYQQDSAIEDPTNLISRTACNAALSFAAAATASVGGILAASRIERFRRLGSRALNAVGRGPTTPVVNNGGPDDPDRPRQTDVDDPDRPHTGDTSDRPHRRGFGAVGGTAFGTVLLTAAPIISDQASNLREWITDSALYGQESLCTNQDAPVVPDSSPGGCSIDDSNREALVDFLMDENRLRRVAANGSNFCDMLEELLLRVYERAVSVNGLLAGNVRVVGQAICDNSNQTYGYNLELDSTTGQGRQTYSVVINESNNTMQVTSLSGSTNFNEINIGYAGSQVQSPMTIRQNGAERTIDSFGPELTSRTQDYAVFNYARSIAQLNSGFFGDAVQGCCRNGIGCEAVGVYPRVQPEVDGDSAH